MLYKLPDSSPAGHYESDYCSRSGQALSLFSPPTGAFPDFVAFSKSCPPYPTNGHRLARTPGPKSAANSRRRTRCRYRCRVRGLAAKLQPHHQRTPLTFMISPRGRPRKLSALRRQDRPIVLTDLGLIVADMPIYQSAGPYSGRSEAPDYAELMGGCLALPQLKMSALGHFRPHRRPLSLVGRGAQEGWWIRQRRRQVHPRPKGPLNPRAL